MDYSTLPKALIYQQKTLNKISELHELNRMVLNNMLDIYSLADIDFESFALPCFNNAYYICTMMRMERNADFRLKRYKIIALNGNEKNTLAQCVTLSLVAILTEHCSQPWREKLRRVCNELKFYATDLWIEKRSDEVSLFSPPGEKPIDVIISLGDMPKSMSRGINDNIILPEELFAPRHIDEKTLCDMDRENHHFEWVNWTKYYDEDIVRELVEGLGSTQQDKAMLIRSLWEKSDSFYVGDYPKQHVAPLLKSLAEEFCPDYLQMTNLYPDESTGATTPVMAIDSHQDHTTASPVQNNEQQSILEQKQTRIKELEEQVAHYHNMEKGIALGLNQGQSSLFVKSMANTFGFSYTNMKKELAPLAHGLFGWGESKLAKYMSTPCNKTERDELANLFKKISPKLYETIMNWGEVPPLGDPLGDPYL